MTTPKAGLKTMPTGILKNEQVFNELAILFEALIYRGVISRAMLDPVGISPPPENGDIYLINDGSPNPTGDWSGQGGKMAVYSDGWRFLPPDEGLTLWIADEAQSVQYRSGVWVDINEVPPQTLGDLSDVDLSGSPSPQDGDGLVFDGALGVWVAGVVGRGFASSFCQLAGKVESFTHNVNKVCVWTEVKDTDGYFGGGTVADEHIVFPFTGRYRITSKVELASESTTNFSHQLAGRKNRGATTTFDNDFTDLRHDSRVTSTAASVRRNSQITGLVDVVAGDEMDILMFHFGVTRDFSGDSFLWVEYLGATPS